jgi:hypothetical protein
MCRKNAATPRVKHVCKGSPAPAIRRPMGRVQDLEIVKRSWLDELVTWKSWKNFEVMGSYQVMKS